MPNHNPFPNLIINLILTITLKLSLNPQKAVSYCGDLNFLYGLECIQVKFPTSTHMHMHVCTHATVLTGFTAQGCSSRLLREQSFPACTIHYFYVTAHSFCTIHR